MHKNTKSITFEKRNKRGNLTAENKRNIAEDRDLVELIQTGTEYEKQSSFAILFEKYQKRLLHRVRISINELPEAEDILQEVFAKIHKHVGKYSPENGSVSNWIYNITRTTIIDHFRSKQLNKTITFSQLSDNMSAHNNESNMIFEVPMYTTPLTNLLDKEKVEQVEAALMKTKHTEAERRMFMEICFNQAPYDEVAEKEGLPIGTLKNLIFRTKEKVRKHLMKNSPELRFAF